MKELDGILFSRMIGSGAASLRMHAGEINDLNVFPIPDGDTGDNMLLTVEGGVLCGEEVSELLSETAGRVSSGMLLSARGNSGVILSQFFEGIKRGFDGLPSADATELGEAFRQGVTQAYGSVMTPAEGTILTVMREATEYACAARGDTVERFLSDFIDEARRSLARTPELLPVLKQAGVVDSGGAGLIYIVCGMLRAARGEEVSRPISLTERSREPDLDAFGEDSRLEFGYCTELLVRLQNSKTDIEGFDPRVITDYLQTVGDSVVTVRSGSILKLHVHTMTPGAVLDFCQRYGEFLKVKIENMSLQHNNTLTEKGEADPKGERGRYGVVAVCSGDGLTEAFRERGADVIVEGGQSMNPSAEDFIRAFDRANAEVIFVFPNNGNVVLTAKQAAGLYRKSDVRVIESTTVGEGYAALAMYDTTSDDPDAIAEELRAAMEGVVTAEISRCVRDASIDGRELHRGEYIGFVGKELLAADDSRSTAVCETVDKVGFSRYDVCILFCGREASESDTREIESYIRKSYKDKEVYVIDGGQEVYDYILVAE